MAEPQISPATTIGPASLQDLRASLRGELILPEDAGYDTARKVWNGMIDRRPALIVRCAGAADVITAVQFARSQDLRIAVRGGGHSAGGKGVCDGGLVVDLSPMKGLRVDPVARTARAEAGLTWGEFDHETQAFGLATTGGQVSTTGIAGLTLGGGIGWLVRTHGFTVDNLLAADLVTADGRLLHVSEEEHSELFWGLRGGGGNFGIVTSFEYQLHPVGPLVTAGLALYPVEQAGEVLRFFREFTTEAPDELMAYVIFLTAPPAPFVPEAVQGQPVVALAVCYVGPLAEGERAVAPRRELGTPLVDVIGPMPYTAVQQMIDPAVPAGLHYYEKAGYLHALDGDVVDTVIAGAGQATSPLAQVILFPLGGAVSHRPEDATAMGNRDAAYGYGIVAAWPGSDDAADQHIGWVREFWTAMQPHSTGRVYVNFLGDEGEVQTAYTPAAYERLVSLKNQYDPTNVFRLNQNIQPTVGR